MVGEKKADKDCLEEDDCQKCKLELNRRIENVEGDVGAVIKQPDGALAMMHEKINVGFQKRPSWTVFWAVISLIFILICGSFAYTHNITKDVVTKADLKDFKEDLNKKLDRIEERLK